MRYWIAAWAASVVFLAPAGAADDPSGGEVRAAFRAFVAAQNAHDLAAVGHLLSEEPPFRWATRGSIVRGRDAALARFAALYEGTWSLAPDESALEVITVRDGVAELVVPTQFSIGARGEPAATTAFVLTQVWVRGREGWRISAILPVPVPPVAAPPAPR
jgi:ketosteroid isomerase-like protein